MCIFKRQKNDRISPLKLLVSISAIPDFFIWKIYGCICGCFFKIGSDHVHGKCFPKTARSCEKINLAVVVNYIFYEKRFVDIIAFFGNFFIWSDSNRTWEYLPDKGVVCLFRRISGFVVSEGINQYLPSLYAPLIKPAVQSWFTLRGVIPQSWAISFAFKNFLSIIMPSIAYAIILYFL